LSYDIDGIANKIIKITYKQIPAGITYTMTSLIITAHYTIVCKVKWVPAFGHHCVMQTRSSAGFRHTIYTTVWH